MAVILAGMPHQEQSILWPRELPPAVIMAPFGLPMPNPDYHP